MVTNPSKNVGQRQIRNNNQVKNIAGQRNIANNSAHRKQNQTGIYKKDIKRQQMNNASVKKQSVKHNTLHTQTVNNPVYKNINRAAPNGAYRQNINTGNISGTYNYSKTNSNGAALNRNTRNIKNTAAAPGRTRPIVNGRVLGRATSIYSETYVINKERINGNYTSDKTSNASRRKKHYMTGDDITTRIRKVKEKINDGRLHAADILKQMFLFKSADQSKIITKEKRKKAIPVKAIFIIVICALFIMTWIFSGMKLHENSLTISKAEADIVKLQKQIKTNEMLLENKNDLVYIENVAVNELGMIKKELLPTQYISVGRGDEVELTNAQNTDYVKVTIETLKDIFRHLK